LICLEGDVNCYIPIGLVDPETTTGDQTVKCWKNWCFVVDEPFTFTEPNDNNDTNTTKNETLCFNEVDCFIVVEIQDLEALVTNETIFSLNGTNYEPLDFAYNVTVPDVSAVLNETVICLKNDDNCYYPIEIVTPDTDTSDKTVKCLWAWCYTVGDPIDNK
jgi:hypothetical protein